MKGYLVLCVLIPVSGIALRRLIFQTPLRFWSGQALCLA
jgi:hypothetical protein